MEIGYFFYGDIIGFSKLVENLDQLSLNKKINEWIDLVNESAKKCSLLKVQLLSDTVYAAVDNEKNSLHKLIRFSKLLLNNGIKLLLPIRGAIELGEYTWDSLIYGRAILEAHKLEKQQKWIGVILHPDITIAKEEYNNFGVINYPVSVSNDLFRHYDSIIWEVPFFHELSILLCLYSPANRAITFDKDSIDKIRNTANFGNFLKFNFKSERLSI